MKQFTWRFTLFIAQPKLVWFLHVLSAHDDIKIIVSIFGENKNSYNLLLKPN